jgi:hypothetical protein
MAETNSGSATFCYLARWIRWIRNGSGRTRNLLKSTRTPHHLEFRRQREREDKRIEKQEGIEIPGILWKSISKSSHNLIASEELRMPVFGVSKCGERWGLQ